MSHHCYFDSPFILFTWYMTTFRGSNTGFIKTWFRNHTLPSFRWERKMCLRQHREQQHITDNSSSDIYIDIMEGKVYNGFTWVRALFDATINAKCLCQTHPEMYKIKISFSNTKKIILRRHIQYWFPWAITEERGKMIALTDLPS